MYKVQKNVSSLAMSNGINLIIVYMEHSAHNLQAIAEKREKSDVKRVYTTRARLVPSV